MTLRSYARVMRKRWRIIVALTLLGLGGAAAITLVMPVTYSAQATAFVAITAPGTDSANSTSNNSLYQSSQFALQRVKSYSNVVNSPAVLEPVIAQLNLNTTVDELQRRVTADNPVDTVLLNVTAKDSSAAGAQRTANAVTDQLGKVIERLETSKEGTTPPVKVTTAVPASVPTAPISPRTNLNMVLGFLVGLSLGIVAAVMRELQDTSMKVDDVEELTGRTPLGLVSFSPRRAQHPLVGPGSNGLEIEELRTIRTNLQFVDVDNPPRVIVVTSAVKGEGKTTFACNLAITLAQSNQNVCFIEADMRQPKAMSYLGLDDGTGLSDVLASQSKVDRFLATWRDGVMSVLPAGTPPPDPSQLLGSHTMDTLLEDVRSRFDVVIIDAPPLLPVSDAAILAHATDGAILVTRYGKTKRDQVTRALDELSNVKANLVGTVLTHAPADAHRGRRKEAAEYQRPLDVPAGRHESLTPGVEEPRPVDLLPDTAELAAGPRRAS